MKTDPKSVFQLVGELRAKLRDKETAAFLNEIEDQIVEKEKWFQKQKQLDEEEIGILRNLAGASPGEVKYRFANQEKEIVHSKRQLEEVRHAVKSVTERNIDLEKEIEKLRDENQHLSLKNARAEGEWERTLENWDREKKMLSEEMEKTEIKFKQSAQELVQTAHSVQERSREEKESLEQKLYLQMHELLFQQKRQILNEERMLLQGLYTFIQNQIGGVTGACRLLKERTSAMKLPEEEAGSFLSRASGALEKIKHAAHIQKKLNQEIALFENTLEQNSVNLQKLQKGLNDFSPFIKMQEPNLEKIFLNEIAEEAIGSLNSFFQRSGIKIQKDWKDVPPICADREMIKSSLIEVLTNAVEAQPSGGEIVLSFETELPNSLIGISIVDRGPGIPRHLVEKIFHAFFTTKENHSGLGLARTARWASSNGGFVETRAESGGGEFILKFPIYKEPNEPQV